MGREIRRVPKDWKHPEDLSLCQPDKPMVELIADWEAQEKLWIAGEHEDQDYYRDDPGCDLDCSYAEWAGGEPDPVDYMPFWPEEQRTHFQMYETCSEGTPISPVFSTPEEVARWCADNGASWFAGKGASYEAWLEVAEDKPNIAGMLVIRVP